MRRAAPAVLTSLAAALLGAVSTAQAPAGQVAYDIQITSGRGGFTGSLYYGEAFGSALAAVGDLDGNGVTDIAVGASKDPDGTFNGHKGAVWILFLDTDSSVKSFQKISALQGGFTGALVPDSAFGAAIASLGDLDGNGAGDIAVGAPQGTFTDGGVVWILFLRPDGTVLTQQAIGVGQGGFTGQLLDTDFFGGSLAPLGDLDGDGVIDLAVGAPGDDDGGENFGAVWILHLKPDGTVKSQQKISALAGGFSGTLHLNDEFGISLATLDDMDGDGVPELASGAWEDKDGFDNAGAVWVLFLAADGTVKSQRKISATSGGFAGPLHLGDGFGEGLASTGDLDGDGRRELVVGAPGDDDGGSSSYVDYGAAWVLFLNPDGTVGSAQKISKTQGGFGGTLAGGARFGSALGDPGDLDGDGAGDLMAGANGFGDQTGDAWLLFLKRGPWTWLGQSLGGSAGTPWLVGKSSLVAGQPLQISLSHAAPSATTMLVAGPSALNVAFKGGVLVPQPDVLVPGATDGQGNALLGTTWPAAVPSGLSVYLQEWIVDAMAPHGLAASNAVVAVAP